MQVPAAGVIAEASAARPACALVGCYFSTNGFDAETGYETQQTGGMTVVYRLDDRVGYAVTGTAPRDALMRIAEQGYRAVLE